jgi:hypothetical protein
MEIIRSGWPLRVTRAVPKGLRLGRERCADARVKARNLVEAIADGVAFVHHLGTVTRAYARLTGLRLGRFPADAQYDI